MKLYNSFDEIEHELKKLDLKRKIAWEEINNVAFQLEEDIKPFNWINKLIKMGSKFGVIILLKKLLR